MDGYYILKGRTPVKIHDLNAWGEFMESPARRVASTEIEGVWISTVFLGLNHNWSGGTPILFETMTFIHDIGEWQTRCSTYDQAEIMHEAMCQRVKNHFDAAGMEANHIIDTIVP